MKIRELIEQLETCNPESRVVVSIEADGQEGEITFYDPTSIAPEGDSSNFPVYINTVSCTEF